MSNKDIIKYFYEVVVSENLLDELQLVTSKPRETGRLHIESLLSKNIFVNT